VGSELLQAALPELASVIRGKTRGRAAVKRVLKKTALKQLGGRKRRAPPRAKAPPRRRKTAKKKKKACKKPTKKKGRTKKQKLSRHNFFSSIDASAR
jgi:hypothetical protein